MCSSDLWKAGGEWAPTRWLRFRGIYNVATRAPSVFELFQAGDQGFPAYSDPCKLAANAANCASTVSAMRCSLPRGSMSALADRDVKRTLSGPASLSPAISG